MSSPPKLTELLRLWLSVCNKSSKYVPGVMIAKTDAQMPLFGLRVGYIVLIQPSAHRRNIFDPFENN